MMASTTNSNDSRGNRKRPATDIGIGDGSDPVIGLNVGGRTFYTHRSTLTNGSSYFAARFGSSFGVENSVTDDDGREVYFIDACPDLFQHILNFLRRGIPTWPKHIYRDDPIFYKRLVGEAEYFGIDSMLAFLQRRPIVFDPKCGKDILYWLGTAEGKEKYKNPLDIGAVSLGGSCSHREQDESLSIFTQHRPLCADAAEFDRPVAEFPGYHWYRTSCNVLECDDSLEEEYLDITFETIAVMPTHYSLRYSDCDGMTCWNFEASTDGLEWTTLHKARGDKSIADPSHEKRDILERILKSRCEGISDASARREIATSIVEMELRHVWKVEGTKTFYRYFRFKGAGEDECENGCMHAAGFELYGAVEEL